MHLMDCIWDNWFSSFVKLNPAEMYMEQLDQVNMAQLDHVLHFETVCLWYQGALYPHCNKRPKSLALDEE
jgi:hypothetical protein